MKLAEASLLLSALVKDWRFVRFATLSRPFIGSGEISLTIAPNEANLTDTFLKRVQQCYRRATELGPRGKATIWAELELQNKPFVSALESETTDNLRQVANNLYAGSTMQGMGHVQAFVDGKKTIYPRKYFSFRVKDSILCLAEALGVSRPPSNQQTSIQAYINYLNQDFEHLIGEVEAALGHEISTPLIGCPPVAEIGSRVFNPDLVRHAYVPHRIDQLGLGKEDQILEIGGGYGCVARYASLRGYKNWTIVDLPYVNAIQMIWLGASLGESSVSGLGEERSNVHLVPSNAKDSLSKQSYSLALNMDSLPEMPEAEADEYLSIVENAADQFLSVNQEARKVHRGFVAQNSVHEMMLSKNMRLVQRSPYWMEQGYVEELYHAN